MRGSSKKLVEMPLKELAHGFGGFKGVEMNGNEPEMDFKPCKTIEKPLRNSSTSLKEPLKQPPCGWPPFGAWRAAGRGQGSCR